MSKLSKEDVVKIKKEEVGEGLNIFKDTCCMEFGGFELTNIS